MSQATTHQHIIVRDDLSAVITYTAEPYVLHFAAYEQAGWACDRKPGELAGCLFELRGDSTSIELTQDIAQAQPMMEGFIKWDGCAHYTFGEDGYLHLCGGHYVRQFAALTTAIFDLAAEKVEKWDAEVAR